jgi:hypothetical protein
MSTAVHPLWDQATPESQDQVHPLWDQATPDSKDVMITPPDKPGFFSGLKASTLDPLVKLFTTNPVDTAKNLAGTVIGKEDLDAIHDAVKKGDYGEAATRVGKWATEGPVGRMAHGIVDPIQVDLQNGNYSHAAGQAAGDALMLAIPEVGRFSGLTKAATAVDPTVAAIRAYGPSAVDVDTIGQALKDVKSASTKPIESNADLIDAAKGYLKNNRDALETWKAIPRDIKAQSSGKAIGDAMLGSAGETLKQENPMAYDAIAQRASTWNRPFSVEELEQRLKESNAKLNGYYGAAQGKQNAMISSGLNVAEEEAKAGALRSTLYKLLDPDGEGAGPREIQQRYGGVANLLNNAIDKQAMIKGQQSISPLAGLREDIMNSTRIFRHGDVIPTNSDALIKSAMANVGEAEPHPIPADTPNVRGYLSSGARQMPPITDLNDGRVTSPPVTNLDRQYVEGRLLNPASSPAGQGTIVPDVLGRAMRGMPDLLESNPGAGNTTVTQGTSEFQVPPKKFQNLKNQVTREVPAKTGTPSGTQGLQRSSDLSEGQVAAIRAAVKDHGTLTKADLAKIAGME